MCLDKNSIFKSKREYISFFKTSPKERNVLYSNGILDYFRRNHVECWNNFLMFSEGIDKQNRVLKGITLGDKHNSFQAVQTQSYFSNWYQLFHLHWESNDWFLHKIKEIKWVK